MGPFDRLRRSPLSLVVLLRRAIADLVDLVMVFYKKGLLFLVELWEDKSCVLGVCLCDACGVVCPKALCVGGGLGEPILVLLL